MADISTLEDLFFRLVNEPDQIEQEVLDRALQQAVRMHIHLPDPPIDSSISTPYMRAFLQIQSDIDRLAGKARFNEGNATRLTKSLKQELELNVVVTEGSSNYDIDLTEVFKKALGKMTGKQIQLVLLFSGALLATTWGAGVWMEWQKEVQIEQIRSAEHIHALEALKFATTKDVELLERMTGVMEQNVEMGRDVIQLVNVSYREILKAAAASGDAVEINGQDVSAEVADLLTITPRAASETAADTVVGRVIDIRTEDLLQPQVEMVDLHSEQKYRFSIDDNLFASEDRSALFRALETGEPIQVEIEIKSVNGDVRSTKFVRYVGPVTDDDPS